MPRLTETIMKSSQVSRIVISASLVAIVGLVTYNWAISPQASYLQAAQQYETVSQDVDKKVKVLSNNVRIKKIMLEKLQARIKSTQSSFFSSGKATDFFGQIEKLSTAAGCNFESMVFENIETTSLDKNNPESLKVTEKKAIVKVAGTYGAIVGFMSALKDYPLNVYLNDLTIRSMGSDTDKLSCSMKLKVYITEDKELLSDE